MKVRSAPVSFFRRSTVRFGNVPRLLPAGAPEPDPQPAPVAAATVDAKVARSLGRLEFYPPHVRGLVYRRAIELSRAARRAARRLLPRTITDRIAAKREFPTRD